MSVKLKLSEYYKWFSEKFTWDRTGGDPITQEINHLYKNIGADGLKLVI